MLYSSTPRRRAESLRKELAYLNVHFQHELDRWNRGEEDDYYEDNETAVQTRLEDSKVSAHDRWTLLTALIEHAKATLA